MERFIREELLLGVVQHIEPDEPLVESGRLDSLALLQLAMFLETQFGIRVEDEELTVDNFRTVERIEEFVRGKLSGA